jgi:UDP-glucose 4-epimerase
VDNLSLGKRENVERFAGSPNYSFYKLTIDRPSKLASITQDLKIDMVFHLAANSDIQNGGRGPEMDYKNTFLTTYAVLEYMREKGVKKIFFASSSAVYGERPGVALDEDARLGPISYYGGAKMASEAFISAFAAMNDFDAIVFRFPNVIGPGLTHGVIFDFIKKLKQNPRKLVILGDGSQNKPYIYVADLIDAVLFIMKKNYQGVHYYNIGVEGSTTVKELADMARAEMGLRNVEYEFSGGDRGWKGDVPSFRFDQSKILNEGWKAQYTSNESVKLAIQKALERTQA